MDNPACSLDRCQTGTGNLIPEILVFNTEESMNKILFSELFFDFMAHKV